MRFRSLLTAKLQLQSVELFNCQPSNMAIVTVKNKYQVVIPQSVRDQVAVSVGDLFDATVEKGRITFTPKSLVDRGIAEGLEDIKKGREYGPYQSAAEAMAAFEKRGAKAAKRRKRGVP